MTVEQYLGYARSILDSYGLTPVITVTVVVGVAFYVYNKFFNKD